MTAYQMVAENGPKICQGPERLVKCADNLAGLPAADGVVLADSNWGNAEMALFSIDPAIIASDNGITVNPDLDLWNPKSSARDGHDRRLGVLGGRNHPRERRERR